MTGNRLCEGILLRGQVLRFSGEGRDADGVPGASALLLSQRSEVTAGGPS